MLSKSYLNSILSNLNPTNGCGINGIISLIKHSRWSITVYFLEELGGQKEPSVETNQTNKVLLPLLFLLFTPLSTSLFSLRKQRKLVSETTQIYLSNSSLKQR